MPNAASKVVSQTTLYTGIIAVAALLVAPFEWWLTPGMDLSATLQGPTPSAPLGTDVLGRNVLMRCIDATRTVVFPLWLVCLIGYVAGIVLASIRETIESAVLRYCWRCLDMLLTAIASIPIILACFFFSVFLSMVSFAGVAVPLVFIAVAKGYHEVCLHHRMDQRLGFWQANRVAGGDALYRLLNYGLCSAWRTRLVEQAARLLQMSLVAEVSLSYLGFGIPEPIPSFGNMLASHYDLLLKGNFHPVLPITAFLVLMLLIPAVAGRAFCQLLVGRR